MNVLIEYKVMNIIGERRDLSHAINQDQIAEKINDSVEQDDFIKPRAVRRIIEELIARGSPIISSPHSPGGYCWGGGPGEALECYKRLRRKGIKILIRARRILRNSKKGQLKIW